MGTKEEFTLSPESIAEGKGTSYILRDEKRGEGKFSAVPSRNSLFQHER